MARRRLAATVAAAAMLGPAAPVDLTAQTAGSTADWGARLRSLDRDLPRWMAEAGVPGLSIAVVTSDSVWNRAYGVANAGEGVAVDGETIFEAASLSKPVFAHMVLSEVRVGTIDLDTPLAEYGRYPDLEGVPWSDRITARMVLSHRSGLPNWRRDQPLTIQFEPGSRFRYSGEGYVYLERTLARLRGSGLEARAREMILEPTGMTRSSFTFDGTLPNHASPHDERGAARDKRPAPPPGNPAASLHSTAVDYGRFVRRLLVEGRADRTHLTPRINQPTPVADGVAWGLGWGLEYPNARSVPTLWHWGDNGPFKAFVYVDPVVDGGFVFFANAANGLALTRRILETLFPGPHPLLAWLDYDQLEDGGV